MIEPTEQELQMIEIIREQKSNFQLVIGSQDGAWEVALSVPSFKSDAARGGGQIFPMPGMICANARLNRLWLVRVRRLDSAEHSACSPPQPGSWMVALS